MTTTEMLQVAGSSGLVTTETSPAASELEPYTNLQASLIGKDSLEFTTSVHLTAPALLTKDSRNEISHNFQPPYLEF